MSSSIRHRAAVAAVGALICLLPAVTAAAGASPDSLNYSVEAAGASRGWLSLQRAEDAAGGAVWHGTGRLEGKGDVAWSLREDAAGHPVAMTVSQTQEGRTMRVEVDLSDQKHPRGKLMAGDNAMPLPDRELPPGTVVIPGLVPVAFAAVTAHLGGVDPATFHWDGHVFNGTLVEPMQITGKGRRELTSGGEKLEAAVFHFAITLPQGNQELAGTLYAAADGRLLGVDWQDATIRLIAAGGDQTATEAVAVPTGDGSLAGVLTIPPRRAGTPPWPVALLVAGPGQDDAAGTVDGCALWTELADQLAAQGIASLRYAPGSGDPLQAALAARAWLHTQPRLDGSAVVAVAHGRGVTVLPRLAVAVGDSLPLQGLVGLAAVPGDAAGFRAAWSGVALPVLLLHGGKDGVTPPAVATALRDTLRACGLTVSCSVAGTLDHTLRRPGQPHCSPALGRQVAAFLQRQR